MPHQKLLIDHAVALALEGNLRTQHVCHHSAAEIDVLPTHAAERRPWVKPPKDAKPNRHYAVCADVIGPAYSPDTEHAKKVSKEHHQYQNPTHVRANHCGIHTFDGHAQ